MATSVAKRLRLWLVQAVSASSESTITELNASDTALMQFCQSAVDAVKHQLHELGEFDLVSKSKWDNNKYLHNARTLLGNAVNMLEDLKADAPPNVDKAKLVLWNSKWKAERARAKRAKDLAAPSTLPKRVRMSQDNASMPGSSVTGSGIEAIMHTLKNHQCSPLVGVPLDAIVAGEHISEGAFGSCIKVSFMGLSYFPSYITYCAKMYKGSNNSKLEQFQKEQGMQKLNPSLVRCIGFTTEQPWVTIFPLFNGGTISSMLLYIPYQDSMFRRVVERPARDEMNFKPSPDRRPDKVQLARIKGFVNNMPNIMHALVDGMKSAHSAGIIHCDLQAKHTILDFTRDNVARVGIIDWGLLLIGGMVRPSNQWVFGAEKEGNVVLDERRWRGEIERQRRPWLAPELNDPLCQDAYSEESDVYALGWLFSCMIEFWKVSQKMYFDCNYADHPDWRKLCLIERRVSERMVVVDKASRTSMAKLNEFMRDQCQTEAARAQRPLVEMGPALTHST